MFNFGKSNRQNMNAQRPASSPQKRKLAIEALEDRALLSVVTWDVYGPPPEDVCVALAASSIPNQFNQWKFVSNFPLTEFSYQNDRGESQNFDEETEIGEGHYLPLATDFETVKVSYSNLVGQVIEDVQGTKDYTNLTNKPSIESVELSGNKTFSDLGLTVISQSDIDTIINGIS